MQINLDVPEEIARNFGEDAKSVERAALEGLALEGIRSGRLSRGQARRLLGWSPEAWMPVSASAVCHAPISTTSHLFFSDSFSFCPLSEMSSTGFIILPQRPMRALNVTHVFRTSISLPGPASRLRSG